MNLVYEINEENKGREGHSNRCNRNSSLFLFGGLVNFIKSNGLGFPFFCQHLNTNKHLRPYPIECPKLLEPRKCMNKSNLCNSSSQGSLAMINMSNCSHIDMRFTVSTKNNKLYSQQSSQVTPFSSFFHQLPNLSSSFPPSIS